MLESAIQSRLTNRLRKEGLMVVKINLCSMSGFPDLQVFGNGKIIFIECKTEGGKPRPLQRVCHEKLRERGFGVIVYDGTEPLEEITLRIKNYVTT